MMMNYRRNASECDIRVNAHGTHGGDACGKYGKACGRIYGIGARRAAVLLALMLGIGSVCAAAENPAGQEPQAVQMSEVVRADAEAAGATETVQADAGAAGATETVQANAGTAEATGAVQADAGAVQPGTEAAASEVSENTVAQDIDEAGAAASASEDLDGRVIFAEEEAPAEADAEILPDDAESSAVGAAPELFVESIQVDDSEAYAGEDLSETGAVENGLTDKEQSEAEDGAVDSETSGECGVQPGTVYWSLDEAGVLTITGNGPMADWESVEQTPWYSQLAELKGIVIAEGVTTVGEHAFSGAQTVGSVELAKSIERVGAFAFYQCGGFGSVTIG